MKNKLLILFVIFSCAISAQQLDTIINTTIYDKIYSKKIGSEREIIIQLPRDYHLEEEEDQRYPLFIVFDGDVLFEIVSGNVDYMSYWGAIPNAIVVGINQIDSRYNDTSVLDNINYTPISSTQNFFEFVGQELIPYIDKKYRTTNFRIAIGHERTANFINFFLIEPLVKRKKKPIINGYILVSPTYTDKMKDYIVQYLIDSKDNLYYYLSTSNQDFKSISEDILNFNETLDSIDKDNFHYKFQNLETPSNYKSMFRHYTLPAYTIPFSIEDMFSIYKNINRVEYDSVILNLETSPIRYLEDKYEKIENYFGVKKEISINDFKAIEQYIDETEKFRFFKDLSQLAKISYKETLLPTYYLGRFYEGIENFKRAIQIYRSTYNMEAPTGAPTKQDLFQRANRLAIEHGYDKKEFDYWPD